ncbi:hypothetical protein B0H19DRAFT_1168148 [Mycena capillaripes]|nr:hypothetical protein B0H19DRAFT_1168148 [Mycena capillaripes]
MLMDRLVDSAGNILVPGVDDNDVVDMLSEADTEERAMYDKLDYSLKDVEDAARGRIALGADKTQVMHLPPLAHGMYGAEGHPSEVGGKLCIRFVLRRRYPRAQVYEAGDHESEPGVRVFSSFHSPSIVSISISFLDFLGRFWTISFLGRKGAEPKGGEGLRVRDHAPCDGVGAERLGHPLVCWRLRRPRRWTLAPTRECLALRKADRQW